MILRAFLFVWRLAWIGLLPLALAYLWRRGRRDALYVQHLGERFGGYGPLPRTPIWIHAVSLGEVRSAVPLARALLDAGETIVFTHMTPAGRREAQAVFADDIAAGRVASVWIPLDMFWTMHRFLRHARPKLGLSMEIEIWPAMVFASKGAGVPFYMCNAQYPRKSLSRDSRGLRLRQRIMTGFTGAFVKSRLQADRFAGVGVSNIQITGELRFDQPIPDRLLKAAAEFAPTLNGRPVITFASTVEGEDAVYLAVITDLVAQTPKPLILYVPRAPERFDDVAALLRDAGLDVVRRSDVFDADLRATHWPDADPDVVLGDSMGEMYFYLSLAQRVVVGGGFHSHGAHNIIEPLALGKPVVTGPTTYTIEYPFVEAQAAGVAISVPDADALATGLRGADWTTSADIDRFMAAHSGASARTVEAIKKVLHD